MHSRQKLRSLFKISKRGRSKPQSIIKTWHKYPIITRFINFNERQHENSPKLGKSLEISYRSPIHFPRDWTRTIFPRKPVENRRGSIEFNFFFRCRKFEILYLENKHRNIVETQRHRRGRDWREGEFLTWKWFGTRAIVAYQRSRKALYRHRYRFRLR